MSFYNFKENIEHVFLDNELIILDIQQDKYYFFNKIESKSIMEILTKEHIKNHTNSQFITTFCKLYDVKQTLNIQNNILGIDNYSWKNVKIQLNTIKINLSILDKLLILNIYISIFNKKSLLSKVQNFKNLKKEINNTNLINKTLAESAAKFIHEISIYFPFKLKCLEYAFILGIFLLRKKQLCSLNIGIQKYNFLAHAWIEDSNNTVIGDNSRLRNDLAKIYTI